MTSKTLQYAVQTHRLAVSVLWQDVFLPRLLMQTNWLSRHHDSMSISDQNINQNLISILSISK